MRLATTATTPPQSARAVVALGRLDMMLEAVADARVAVVHAPAGYGKTTAMLYWARRLREQGRPVMWLAARAGLALAQNTLLPLTPDTTAPFSSAAS